MKKRKKRNLKKLLSFLFLLVSLFIGLYVYDILPVNNNEFFLNQHQFTVNIKSKKKLQTEFLASFSTVNLNEFENKLYLDVKISGLNEAVDSCEVSIAVPIDIMYSFINMRSPEEFAKNLTPTSYDEISMPYTPHIIYPEYGSKYFVKTEAVIDYKSAMKNAKIKRKIKTISFIFKNNCTLRLIVENPLTKNGWFKRYFNLVILSYSSGQDLKYKVRLPKGFNIDGNIESNLNLKTVHETYKGDYLISDTYNEYCFDSETKKPNPNSCASKFIFLNLKKKSANKWQGFYLMILGTLFGTLFGIFVSDFMAKSK